jgi:acyl dehydratase
VSDIVMETIDFAPLTRTDFVRYAGASGDFNPLHHDAEYARAAGLPDVMGHGMLSAGLLATAVTRWFGSDAVEAFSVRFQTPVWPGDRLTATGHVVGIAREAVGVRVADIDLVLARDNGDRVVRGNARVRLVGASSTARRDRTVE